jgi:hypothetical protein
MGGKNGEYFKNGRKLLGKKSLIIIILNYIMIIEMQLQMISIRNKFKL